MIEVEIFCDRCALYERRRMNISDAIEKLGSFCPKCITGVNQVRKIEKRKKKEKKKPHVARNCVGEN